MSLRSTNEIMKDLFKIILKCLNYVSTEFTDEDIIISFGNDKDMSLDGVGELNIRYSLFQSNSETMFIGANVKKNTVIFDLLVSRVSRISEGEQSYESLLLLSEVEQLLVDSLYSSLTSSKDIENVIIDSTDYLPLSFNGKNLDSEGLNHDEIEVNGDKGFMVGATFAVTFSSAIDKRILDLSDTENN